MALRDVLRVVARQHRQVGGLAEPVDEPREHGLGVGAYRGSRGGAEGHEPVSQRVTTVGHLTHISTVDEGLQEAVDRRQRDLAGRRDLADRHLPAPCRNDLEQPECALDRLDAGRRRADREGFLVDGGHDPPVSWCLAVALVSRSASG